MTKGKLTTPLKGKLGFAMKNLLVWLVIGVLFSINLGCSGGTTEAQPDPIDELNLEEPPVGDDQ